MAGKAGDKVGAGEGGKGIDNKVLVRGHGIEADLLVGGLGRDPREAFGGILDDLFPVGGMDTAVGVFGGGFVAGDMVRDFDTGEAAKPRKSVEVGGGVDPDRESADLELGFIALGQKVDINLAGHRERQINAVVGEEGAGPGAGADEEAFGDELLTLM